MPISGPLFIPSLIGTLALLPLLTPGAHSQLLLLLSHHCYCCPLTLAADSPLPLAAAHFVRAIDQVTVRLIDFGLVRTTGNLGRRATGIMRASLGTPGYK